MESLLRRLVGGERGALARTISLVENGSAARVAEISAALAPHLGRAHVIGVTGAPGAGKSTLINALIGELLRRGRKIGVVAVDPSSPLTGGAILGDRIRMGEHGAHRDVFIRSLPARGHLGGLSRATAAVVDLLDAAGVDTVIVETVGTGQSEVEITGVADTRLVVCPPGLGDDIQAIKAGILEIADVLVVNKADLPLAEQTARDLRDMLGMRRHAADGWQVPVLLTAATSTAGVAALLDASEQHGAAVGHGTRLAHRHVSPQPLEEAAGRVANFAATDPYVQDLGIEHVAGGLGHAAVRLRIAARHLNFMGTCHGGVIFALADTAFGLAANSHGPVAAGVDAHITYQLPVLAGDVLTASAVEVSRSRKLGVYRIDVARQDGALVSAFTGTVYVKGKKPDRHQGGNSVARA